MHKFLLVQDYLTYRLTGELVTTSSAAVMTGCLDVADRHRWAEDILQDFELKSSIWVDKVHSKFYDQVHDLIHQASGIIKEYF